MKIEIQKSSLKNIKDETLILPFYQKNGKTVLPSQGAPFKKTVEQLSKDESFKADFKEVFFLPYAQGGKHWVFVGLGKKEDIRRNRIREALLKASLKLRDQSVQSITFALSLLDLNQKYSTEALVQLSLESLILPLYQFNKFKKESKKKEEVKSVTIVVEHEEELKEGKKGLSKAKKYIETCNFVRDLVNTPHNEMTAPTLAEIAKTEAEKANIKVTVWGEKELQKEGFGAFLAVNRGSDIPPRFVILDYTPQEKEVPTVCLVGKGITFDTGGISLKPSQNLDEMKMDMAGSATVLGILLLCSKLNLPLRVVGFMCLTNNMPSGKATVPGDIVTAYNGKTIEILNTDAEGRLVLADGLAYADKNYSPDLIIDFATLTGACVVALGNVGSAILGTDQKSIDRLKELNCETGEKIWQLPLWDEYDEDVKGENADLRNIGTDRGAGTAKAAVFLKSFVRDQTPWIHFDIAGSAYVPKPTHRYAPKGATAACVRLVTTFLSQYHEEAK
ncbi:MAG: leucyl aminopeptidase [Deltaproteobacteria bacterium]|nr:leucyl aminopeptidase [Deltaproteobacteria bacterium]